MGSWSRHTCRVLKPSFGDFGEFFRGLDKWPGSWVDVVFRTLIGSLIINPHWVVKDALKGKVEEPFRGNVTQEDVECGGLKEGSTVCRDVVKGSSLILVNVGCPVRNCSYSLKGNRWIRTTETRFAIVCRAVRGCGQERLKIPEVSFKGK